MCFLASLSCFLFGYGNTGISGVSEVAEGLLVGFFLAGLVTLGSMQSYWLKPLIDSLSGNALFFGATGLTAIHADNAAR